MSSVHNLNTKKHSAKVHFVHLSIIMKADLSCFFPDSKKFFGIKHEAW